MVDVLHVLRTIFFRFVWLRQWSLSFGFLRDQEQIDLMITDLSAGRMLFHWYLFGATPFFLCSVIWYLWKADRLPIRPRFPRIAAAMQLCLIAVNVSISVQHLWSDGGFLCALPQTVSAFVIVSEICQCIQVGSVGASTLAPFSCSKAWPFILHGVGCCGAFAFPATTVVPWRDHSCLLAAGLLFTSFWIKRA